MLIGLTTSSVARADLAADEAAGRIHFQSGREYYADARFALAFAEFVEAYRLTGLPELLFNRARCLEELKHDAEALACYREYLSSALSLDQVDAARRANAIAARLAPRQAPVACPEQLAVDRPTVPLPSSTRVERRPVYKRWWFWTAIVGGVVVVAGVTTGAVLATQPSDSPVFPAVTP